MQRSKTGEVMLGRAPGDTSLKRLSNVDHYIDERMASKVARRITRENMIALRAELFTMSAMPGYVRSYSRRRFISEKRGRCVESGTR